MEWWEQFLSPWKKSGFALYFVIFVIVLGCVGIYLSIYRTIVEDSYSSWNIFENILTYSIALTMPASVNLILNSFYRTDKKVSLTICTIALFVILPLVLSVFSFLLQNVMGVILSIICFLISLIVWVLANYDNSNLSDASYEKNIKSNVENNSKGWE